MTPNLILVPNINLTLNQHLYILGGLTLLILLFRHIAHKAELKTDPEAKPVPKTWALPTLIIYLILIIYGMSAHPYIDDVWNKPLISSVYQLKSEMNNPFPSDAPDEKAINTVIVYYRPDCPDCTQYQQDIRNAVSGYDTLWLNTNKTSVKEVVQKHKVEWVPTIVIVYEHPDNFVTVPLYVHEDTDELNTQELDIALKHLK